MLMGSRVPSGSWPLIRGDVSNWAHSVGRRWRGAPRERWALSTGGEAASSGLASAAIAQGILQLDDRPRLGAALLDNAPARPAGRFTATR